MDNDDQYPDTTVGAQQQGPILDPIDTDLAKVFQLHRVPHLGIQFFLSSKSLIALLPDGVSHLESQGQPSVSTLHSLPIILVLMGISLVGPCDSQPCQNGGTCIPEGVDKYHCLCPLAFGGEINCGMYTWASQD